MYVVPEGRRKLVLCELLCPGVELYSIIGYLNDAGICQETSRRDTANKRSLELCASIVLIF